MEQGMTNTIDINLIEEVGDIQKLSVRQDGSKLFSDWHLDRITLTPVDLATDQPIAAKTKTFIFDKVLKAKKIAESGGTPVSNPAKLKIILNLNRYTRKRPKVDASIFDSALSHTRRSDASEKKRRK